MSSLNVHLPIKARRELIVRREVETDTRSLVAPRVCMQSYFSQRVAELGLESTLGNRHERRHVVSQEEFKQGDEVEWNTPQGKTRGMVKKKLTSRTKVGGQTVAASEDDPRYLVESEKSGKEAAHKPDALNKV
jgi:hypothetical protein